MRRNPKIELTLDVILEALAYDPDTGILRHLKRPARGSRQVPAEKPNRMGYTRVSIADHRLLAHRVAWAIAHRIWPLPYDIDHINGNRSDNRLCNLRPATHAQNLRNRSATRISSTGAKGVYRIPSGKFTARVVYNYKNTYLGAYDTLEEAKAAYDKAARDLHGAFFRH